MCNFMTNDTTTKQEKVFNLCKDLDDIKRKKKDVVKGYNEEIKRLQGEIKDLIDPFVENEELP
jgi:hypothetical protein